MKCSSRSSARRGFTVDMRVRGRARGRAQAAGGTGTRGCLLGRPLSVECSPGPSAWQASGRMRLLLGSFDLTVTFVTDQSSAPLTAPRVAAR